MPAVGVILAALIGSAGGQLSSVPVPVPAPGVANPPPVAPRPHQASVSASAELAASESLVDRHLEELRASLGVTAAQLPLWRAFTHAVREMALSDDALTRQRRSALATMTAADNMRDYARVAHIYAENAERLADAFDRLYIGLSPSQRRIADAAFRRQALSAPPGR